MFFMFFNIFQFFIILGGFRDQIRIPGEISCPGMVSDPRASIFCYVRDFRPNSDFGRPNSLSFVLTYTQRPDHV